MRCAVCFDLAVGLLPANRFAIPPILVIIQQTAVRTGLAYD